MLHPLSNTIGGIIYLYSYMERVGRFPRSGNGPSTKADPQYNLWAVINSLAPFHETFMAFPQFGDV